MRRQIWIVCIVVGLFAWLGPGPGFVFAQGDPNFIYPVSTTFPYLPDWSSQVTLSILDSSGKDITAVCDFQPNQKITIIGNGLSGSTISLVGSVTDPIANQALYTSAYPGVCTNYDDPTIPSDAPDFSLNGNELTVKDFGGMAVVQVTATGAQTYKFIIPQDTNFNGIPDWYERKFCGTQNCLDRTGDIDKSADTLIPMGDGFANIDEYRGFRVDRKSVV